MHRGTNLSVNYFSYSLFSVLLWKIFFYVKQSSKMYLSAHFSVLHLSLLHRIIIQPSQGARMWGQPNSLFGCSLCLLFMLMSHGLKFDRSGWFSAPHHILMWCNTYSYREIVQRLQRRSFENSNFCWNMFNGYQYYECEIWLWFSSIPNLYMACMTD